jgi:RHS repeat-associated protein
VFNYTDHLGNVRVSFAKDPQQGNVLKILEENHYYAFGMKHENYNVTRVDFRRYPDTGVELVPMPAVANASYNYKFGGNEFQEELGLNVYDYDNRVYDQAIGRFWQMDPLAENGRRFSPYNYCFNNPIYFQDPDGMWPSLPSWNDVKKSYNEAKATVTKSYNQAKASATRTYNETKASATKTYNEAKATVTKTYNETKKTLSNAADNVVSKSKEAVASSQKWVKENQGTLLKTAKVLQTVGDQTTTTGLVAAVAGAPVAGVGAAPGLTTAAVGGAISGLGDLLEIGTNFIAGDVDDSVSGTTNLLVGEVAGAVVDKAIPGPNPDVSKGVSDFLNSGKKATESMASDKAKEASKKLQK